MNVIVESERDRRTLAWLIEQVGQNAVERACANLGGKRKPYPSNLAKILGLVPPESLCRPSPVQVKLYLAEMRKLVR
ncbi:MAG: cryptic plasmid protein A [Candidatus Methylophosphatis roskildensis]